MAFTLLHLIGRSFLVADQQRTFSVSSVELFASWPHPCPFCQLGAYCLNFNGRVTHASVKNFQLVTDEDKETTILQFGKVRQHPAAPEAVRACLHWVLDEHAVIREKEADRRSSSDGWHAVASRVQSCS
jgi:hypothetical protein